MLRSPNSRRADGPSRSRQRARILALLCLLPAAFLLFPPAEPVDANGGTLRVANEPVGDYLVSVFTDPTPVRTDSIDVSALVLMSDEPGLAEGIRVQIQTRGLEGQGDPVRLEATREQADDPRYHAAKFGLGAPGLWEIDVAVDGPRGSGSVSFEITAREIGFWGSPLFLSLLALLPLALIALWILRDREE